MATAPFSILVLLSPSGDGGWAYDITLNGKRLIHGERTTQHAALRAARAQLTQLQRDIQKALDSL